MNQEAYVLSLLIMAFSVVGAILPVVPGPPIAWLGALFYGWSTDWTGIGFLGLGILFIIALVGSTADWWLSAVLLKKSGGSLWGTLGAFVGGIIGFFVIPFAGIIIGSLLGVAVVEWLRHRDPKQMLRAGKGYLVGWLLSTVVEVVASLVIIGLFVAIAG